MLSARSFHLTSVKVELTVVAGELERRRWGQMPPREGSRCSSLTLVRMRVLFRTLRLEHLPQVLPLFDPRLPLALPTGG